MGEPIRRRFDLVQLTKMDLGLVRVFEELQPKNDKYTSHFTVLFVLESVFSFWFVAF